MKKPTVAVLKRKADKVFSLAIRLRDSDKNGYGRCITCSKRVHYKEAHAGHFISRRYGATRYDEENVNLQCTLCNTFRAGEQYKYGLEVDLKYGNGTAEKLHAKANSDFRFSVPLLEEIIKDSKEQVKWYENS